MNQRAKAWSEAHGSADDITYGLGDFDGGDVSDLAVKRGIILLTDCSKCGRQWKGEIPWGEVAMWWMNKFDPRSQRPTRQGIMLSLKCNGGTCQKPFPTIVDWDELRKWVDIGVLSGCLDPRIKQVKR